MRGFKSAYANNVHSLIYFLTYYFKYIMQMLIFLTIIQISMWGLKVHIQNIMHTLSNILFLSNQRKY